MVHIFYLRIFYSVNSTTAVPSYYKNFINYVRVGILFTIQSLDFIFERHAIKKNIYVSGFDFETFIII